MDQIVISKILRSQLAIYLGRQYSKGGLQLSITISRHIWLNSGRVCRCSFVDDFENLVNFLILQMGNHTIMALCSIFYNLLLDDSHLNADISTSLPWFRVFLLQNSLCDITATAVADHNNLLSHHYGWLQYLVNRYFCSHNLIGMSVHFLKRILICCNISSSRQLR